MHHHEEDVLLTPLELSTWPGASGLAPDRMGVGLLAAKSFDASASSFDLGSHAQVVGHQLQMARSLHDLKWLPLDTFDGCSQYLVTSNRLR